MIPENKRYGLINDPSLEDKPREECGVFAVYSQNRTDISRILYYGLQALQHRGQESSGISVYNKNENTMKTYKNLGLVVDVFKEKDLNNLEGNMGIGHVRYSTVGGASVESAQPFVTKDNEGKSYALAHNGTISNASNLRELLKISADEKFLSDSDTEIILRIIGMKIKIGMEKAVGSTASLLQGSYSLVVMSEDAIVGAKDPFGIRPLCIGKLEDDAYVFASESSAFNAVGAEYIREVEAGEIVTIDKNGIHSYKFAENNMPAPCAFEKIYFSRPDSFSNNESIYKTRLETGKLLYEQTQIRGDIVLGVPQSGNPAAIGYAEASSIPYEMGILKNEYTKRSFINPTQEMRNQEISIKLTVVSQIVKDKCLIVIDDSLVRGNTSKRLITMLRNAGAKEVHFMAASPPVKFPCYFGIDIAKRKELAANNKTIEDLAKDIGADSLHYLSLENLQKAFRNKPHCFGCFTGTYPTYAPMEENI